VVQVSWWLRDFRSCGLLVVRGRSYRRRMEESGLSALAALVGLVGGIGCCVIPAILGLLWLVATAVGLFDDRPPLV
jgi:hypothetical protein